MLPSPNISLKVSSDLSALVETPSVKGNFSVVLKLLDKQLIGILPTLGVRVSRQVNYVKAAVASLLVISCILGRCGAM